MPQPNDTRHDTVSVALGSRAYHIHIGEGLLQEAGSHVAPLLKRPFTAYLVPHIQFVAANDTQSIATPLVATSDRLHPRASRMRQLSCPSAVAVTRIQEQRNARLDVGHSEASHAAHMRCE